MPASAVAYPFRRILWLLAAGLWAISPVRAAEAELFFDPSLGDFRAELGDARRAGKSGVLLMFGIEDCPYCRKMKQNVLNREDVQAYFHKHFAIFAVDVLGDVRITDFDAHETSEKQYAKSMRVRGTPTFVFVGLDGRELTRYVGATRDAGEFMQLGRYVVDGHYKTRRFDQYYPDSQPEQRKP